MTEDKASYKIDTKFNYEDGVLEINIPDILAQLDQDDLKSIGQLHAFDSAIWNEIERRLRDEVTSSNFNGNLHKLRIELFVGDGSDRILRKLVHGILFDKNSAERGKDFYRKNYWQLRRWCNENLTLGKQRTMPDEIKMEDATYVKDVDVEKAIESAGGS